MQLFLDAFVLALLVLIHLYRPGENLWCHDVTQYKSYFFNFFIYFCSFRSFRWFRFGRFARFACFGRFGGFVSLVSLVSLVSVVSFRPFRFVVSGFSTCLTRAPRSSPLQMTVKSLLPAYPLL